jgi:hypothetical protein
MRFSASPRKARSHVKQHEDCRAPSGRDPFLLGSLSAPRFSGDILGPCPPLTRAAFPERETKLTTSWEFHPARHVVVGGDPPCGRSLPRARARTRTSRTALVHSRTLQAPQSLAPETQTVCELASSWTRDGCSLTEVWRAGIKFYLSPPGLTGRSSNPWCVITKDSGYWMPAFAGMTIRGPHGDGISGAWARAPAKRRAHGLCDQARRPEPPISARYPKALPLVQAWLPPPPIWRNAGLFPDSL